MTLKQITKTKCISRQLVILACVFSIACQKSNDSFSLLAEQSNFQQASSFQPRKIDILWVIDNSGSMATSQANVISNFQSFIKRFQNLNYDFHMAVTTTDAYLEKLDQVYSNKVTARKNSCSAFPNYACSLLRDGPGNDITAALHSGVSVMTKDTLNLETVFTLNANQGVSGYGDERAFLSMRDALENPANSNFLRKGSFLAVIILSDEDDYSHSAMTPVLESLPEGYLNYSQIHKVSDYVNFLDQITDSTVNQKNYSVNSIAILDETCKAQLASQFAGRRIGQRYIQLTEATGGTKASLCGNFGESLELISNMVLTLTSSFKLDREPIVETIKVIVDGKLVTSDVLNGWTYDAVNFSVNFHGSSIPAADSQISITFDPVTVK